MFRRKKNPFDMLNHFDSMFEIFDSMMSSFNPSSIIMGEVKTESGSDENGDWTKQSFVSEDGTMSIESFIRTNGRPKNKESDKLSNFKRKLEIAVENQNFEEAVKLRDEIKKQEKNKDKLDSLKSDLEKSIKEQDYEKAIELRDKIKSLE